MPLRTLSLILMAALLVGAAPVQAAKQKKPAKQATQSWKTVVDYVLSNGVERTLRAPITRNIGIESDSLVTKALRYKLDGSPDKKMHAIYVIPVQDKDGKTFAKEFILGNGFSIEKDGVKYVEDYFVRADLNGKILGSIITKGPAGHIEEERFASDSAEATAHFKAEQKLYLETMGPQKLTK